MHNFLIEACFKHCMGHTLKKKKIVVYLKFKYNWTSCPLSPVTKSGSLGNSDSPSPTTTTRSTLWTTLQGQADLSRTEFMQNSRLWGGLPQLISFYSKPFIPLCLVPFSGLVSSRPMAVGPWVPPWKLREKRQQRWQCPREAAGSPFNLCHGDTAYTEDCHFTCGQIKPAAYRQPKIGFLKCWGFRNASGVVHMPRHLLWVSTRRPKFQTFPTHGLFSWCGPGTSQTQTICRPGFKKQMLRPLPGLRFAVLSGVPVTPPGVM